MCGASLLLCLESARFLAGAAGAAAILHREHLAVGRAYVIDGACIGELLDFTGNQDVQSVYLGERFISIRLIQSQPQLGSASAESSHHHPHIFARVLLQDFRYLALCSFSYLHHPLLLNC